MAEVNKRKLPAGIQFFSIIRKKDISMLTRPTWYGN